jgi:CBS domain-containing protein
VRVKTLMRGPVSIAANGSLGEATELMARTGIRDLPVLWNDALVGILTERDARRAGPSLASWLARYDFTDCLKLLRVNEIMTRPAAQVTPETALADAARLLATLRMQVLPVVEAELLVGVVTGHDLRSYLLARLEHESPARLREVLAVVDGPDTAPAMVAAATAITADATARLTVLRLLPPLPWARDGLRTAADARIAGLQEHQATEELRDLVGPEDCKLRYCVARGDGAAAIVKVAIAVEADVIVMARPPRRWPGGTGRATTDELTRLAPCPVLVVPT